MDKSTKDRKKLFRARVPRRSAREGVHGNLGLPAVTEEQGPHRRARPEQQMGGLLQHHGARQGKWQQNHRRVCQLLWSHGAGYSHVDLAGILLTGMNPVSLLTCGSLTSRAGHR